MDSPEVLEIKNILVENWNHAFHVKESSSEIDIYVEVLANEKSTGLWKYIPMHTNEKKFIYIHKVPSGYIKMFFKDG